MDDSHHVSGPPMPRPRILRVVRLWSTPGRELELMDRAERATRAVRATYSDVPFRSYLARTFLEGGRVEVLGVTVWDTPEDMRRVVANVSIALQPFRVETYGDTLERWELTTYEVYFPRPLLSVDEEALDPLGLPEGSVVLPAERAAF